MNRRVPSVHDARRIARGLAACHAVLLLGGAPPACAEVLPELLAAVASSARFATPLRADVRIECGGCEGAGRQAIFLGRGDTLYVEVKDGQRALVRPGHVLVTRDGKAVEAAAGQSFAGSDLLLEDLAVFVTSSLKVPQISDDGPAGVVVTSAPSAPSAYALLVHTIDRDHHTIVRTLYYSDLINNLSKTRRDTGWTEIGGSWRPAEMTVESVRQGTRTHLALVWHEAPDAPAALFEPGGLEKASGLAWP
jgi:outer membrane lipoprotein-sorting protein